jgi:hypothetical protein
MSIATFVDVEAALLNSEDNPSGEIVEALRAVVRFSRNEIEADNEAILRMMQDAIDAEDERAAGHSS